MRLNNKPQYFQFSLYAEFLSVQSEVPMSYLHVQLFPRELLIYSFEFLLKVLAKKINFLFVNIPTLPKHLFK